MSQHEGYGSFIEEVTQDKKLTALGKETAIAFINDLANGGLPSLYTNTASVSTRKAFIHAVRGRPDIIQQIARSGHPNEVQYALGIFSIHIEGAQFARLCVTLESTEVAQQYSFASLILIRSAINHRVKLRSHVSQVASEKIGQNDSSAKFLAEMISYPGFAEVIFPRMEDATMKKMVTFLRKFSQEVENHNPSDIPISLIMALNCEEW